IAVVAAAPYSRFPEPYARSIYDPARVWAALDAIGERPVQLVLAATDTLVMISRARASPLGVRTDGEEIEPRIRGLSTEIRAKWDEGRLRIERTLPSGLEIRETWQLERPDRLTVRVKATGPIPREIDVRWVYRRCEEPAGPSEEPAGPSPAISKSS